MKISDFKALALATLVGINSFAAGIYVSSHQTHDREQEEITEAHFGFMNLDLEEFPECQTDMAMGEHWTTRLMYLNGVWTAGCVDLALKRHIEREALEKEISALKEESKKLKLKVSWLEKEKSGVQ